MEEKPKTSGLSVCVAVIYVHLSEYIILPLKLLWSKDCTAAVIHAKGTPTNLYDTML